MKRSLASLALTVPVILSACASSGGHDAGAGDDVWVSLFDGVSTDAWRGYRADELPAGWRIEDGALTRAAPAGDIITRDQYGSFILEFEWRVESASNSGVFFHVTEKNGATYESGPEYQILDNTAHGDGLDPRTSAAANYALHAPHEDLTRPVGEWNQGRLAVLGTEVQHWLNGELVVQYEIWSDDWNARVRNSKFVGMPAYGLAPHGHIALQDHGDRVQYRNIRVLPLD